MACAVLLACVPARAALVDSDEHYGVYLQGTKVGWMRVTLTGGRAPRLATELHASVGGMGMVSTIELNETRTYDAKSGTLARIDFVQKAATGAVTVRGQRKGELLELEVNAGGSVSRQQVSVDESLNDALALEELAKSGVVGAKQRAKRFDPSLLKVVDVEHTVVAIEERLLAGLASRVVKLTSHYAALGVSETAWIDSRGTVLESQVGGFFVAKLEPPEQAKRLDQQQDLLVAAVVKTPRPIVRPEAIERLELTMKGFDLDAPPSSPRQAVTREGELVKLVMTREAQPQIALATVRAHTGTPAELLEATPFIQSKDERLAARARSVVGDAKDVFTATSRLSGFVFSHVKDEYVPAFSNALEALDSGRGDCTEHAVLFVAMARALGIPARVAVGVAYWPPGGGFGWHAWAEVSAAGTWYTVDPTWNQPIADATHLKLADGGPAEQARIVMLLGKLQVVSQSSP